MRVGIDANEANTKNKVGVNVYAFELLWALYKLQAINKKSKDPINYTLYLNRTPRKDMPKERDGWKYKVLPAKRLWILTKLTPHLFFNPEKLDVFFSPSHYLPPVLTVPGVCSIMDLGYLEFSGQFRKKDFWQLKLWTAKSLSVSKQIIAISNSTKKDIVRHYHLAPKRVSVTHLAHDKQRFNPNIDEKGVGRVRRKYAIVGDYILYLSTLKPSKNVMGLIDAFAIISNNQSKGNNTKLVIAGKKGWLYESIFKRVEELGLKERIIFTGYIDEEDKAPLIKGARVFALPSFWEGFGFDPLYALALGTPVVASNRGSLPEVVGTAGKLVDPSDIKGISLALGEVLSMSKTEYNSTISKGFKQADKFSWEKTAKETVAVFKKAVN